ncbi:MAG: hypothetical protein ACFFD1_01735 [Candidatus Thorarchaeota archaeon]
MPHGNEILKESVNELISYLNSFQDISNYFIANLKIYLDISVSKQMKIEKITGQKYNLSQIIFQNYPTTFLFSFLKTIIENDIYYEFTPNFLNQFANKYHFTDDLERSIIFLSQELHYSKILILFKIVKGLCEQETNCNLHPLIKWFVVGELFASSNWVYNRPTILLTEIESNNSLFDIIYRTFEARKHFNAVNLDSMTKIFRSLANIFINQYGPELTLNSLLEFYIQEGNPTIRYAFHKSYINLLKEGLGPVDMILSATSSFIRAEHDINILLEIFNSLNETYSWKTISHIASAILNHNDIRNIPDSFSSFYLSYYQELENNIDNILPTFNVFLKFWILVDDHKKHDLFLFFKSWIENSNNTTTTIKKVYLRSLIAQTIEVQWLHLLGQLNEQLGPSRVIILEDRFNPTNLRILEKDNRFHKTQKLTNTIDSSLEGLFCLGCRRKIDKENIHNKKQCSDCLAIFCDYCYSIYTKLDYQSYKMSKNEKLSEESNILCLGSSLYGFTHEFHSL